MGITRRDFVINGVYAAILAGSGCLKKAGEKVADIAVKDTPQLSDGPPGSDFQYDITKIPYDLSRFKYFPTPNRRDMKGAFYGDCNGDGKDLCMGVVGNGTPEWYGLQLQNHELRKSYKVIIKLTTAEIEQSQWNSNPEDLRGMEFYTDIDKKTGKDIRMVRVPSLLEKMKKSAKWDVSGARDWLDVRSL